MKSKFFLLIITLICILVSNFSNAQERQNTEPKYLYGIKNLTENQITKIEQINFKSDKQIIQYKADLQIKKAELNKLKIADTPSSKAINAKIDEISVLKANIEKEKIAKKIAVRNELTPEQKAEFNLNAKLNHGKKDHAKARGEFSHKQIHKAMYEAPLKAAPKQHHKMTAEPNDNNNN